MCGLRKGVEVGMWAMMGIGFGWGLVHDIHDFGYHHRAYV